MILVIVLTLSSPFLLIIFFFLQAMNTRRTNARRAKEDNVNEKIPSQASQNPQVPIEEVVMSNVNIRDAKHSLTQVLATQVARDNRVQVNPNVN